MRRALVFVALIVVVLGVAASAGGGDSPRPAPAPAVSWAPVPDLDLAAHAQHKLAELHAYLAAEEARIETERELAQRLPVDVALWERIHQCEQADSWYTYGTFGNGLRGGGGLGMSDGAWSMAVNAARARGVELPGFVLDATPFQQMQAAQAFYDAHGWAWGCKP